MTTVARGVLGVLAGAMSVLLLWAVGDGFALAEDKGNAEAGQLAFNNACRTCHTINKDDNRLGPSLHKIIGKKAGSVQGYAYSDSMKNSGITWDEKTLDRFIENPDSVVAGNNMKPYTGMTNAEDRAKIVAYLKAQSEG